MSVYITECVLMSFQAVTEVCPVIIIISVPASCAAHVTWLHCLMYGLSHIKWVCGAIEPQATKTLSTPPYHTHTLRENKV